MSNLQLFQPTNKSCSYQVFPLMQKTLFFLFVQVLIICDTGETNTACCVYVCFKSPLSTFCPLQFYLMFSPRFTFQDSQFIFLRVMWFSEFKTKSNFIFQEVENEGAGSNNRLLRQLVLQSAGLLPQTCGKNTHVLPLRNLGTVEFLSFLSPSLEFSLYCQSRRVGGVLTAFSLGFLLLIKFPPTFFSYPSPLLFQTHRKCRQTCRHHSLR